MKELFLLSGLGADKRVFNFLDLSAYKINHIEWIEPLPKESLEQYAKRLLPQIKNRKPILIGVSFGGMIAIEIGKLIHTDKIVLISSAQKGKDIPLSFRIMGRLGLNKLLPDAFLKKPSRPTFWSFGTSTEAERVLLRSIIRETDPKFLRWAISKIARWKNVMLLKNVVTIHGTNDRLLPDCGADYKISSGGHLMILNKAVEIDAVLKEVLR